MITPLSPPRGLRHYANAGPSVFSGLLAMCLLSAWLFSQSLNIFQGWNSLAHGLSLLAGSPLEVVMSLKGGLAVVVALQGDMPDWSTSIFWCLGIAAVLLGLSFGVDKGNVPAKYLLRTFAVILALPCLGLISYGNVTVFDAEAHISTVFQTGYWFLVFTPIFYAATAFVLPGNFVYRAFFVLLAVGYFYLLVPVLALFHYHLLLLVGPAASPLLSVVFNVLLFSVEFIAFYGVIASQP